MSSTRHPDPAAIAAHYTARLSLETDCADVRSALEADPQAFVLVDTRSPEAYRAGHLPLAVSLPHAEMTVAALAAFGEDATFVTYCWGPHCNGATKGAARIATLGWPVREMLGGVWGWEMEGYPLEADDLSAEHDAPTAEED